MRNNTETGQILQRQMDNLAPLFESVKRKHYLKYTQGYVNVITEHLSYIVYCKHVNTNVRDYRKWANDLKRAIRNFESVKIDSESENLRRKLIYELYVNGLEVFSNYYAISSLTDWPTTKHLAKVTPTKQMIQDYRNILHNIFESVICHRPNEVCAEIEVYTGFEY